MCVSGECFSSLQTRFSHKLNVKQILKENLLCSSAVVQPFIAMNIIYATLLSCIWNKTESFSIIFIRMLDCCSKQSEPLLMMRRCDMVRTKQQDKVNTTHKTRERNQFFTFFVLRRLHFPLELIRRRWDFLQFISKISF